MDETKKKAVIAGALGVVGRNLLGHLIGRGWEVIGLSRRAPDFETQASFIAVDLADADDSARKLGALEGVTHIFSAAFQFEPRWVDQWTANSAMLRNMVEPIEAASPGLEHVHILQGTKYYGAHLGPFKTPAKETDQPHLGPNFYIEQQRWLEARQEGKAWAWSASRPHTVCGYARGNAMNLINVIGVYGTLCRELGLPLRYPGPEAAYRAVYQLSDADLLAEAVAWCATSPAARNQAFNITNGDYMRWENLWPKIAAFFGLEPGSVQRLPLAEFMPPFAGLWEEICRKHHLEPTTLAELADWRFADYIFGCTWDIMSSTMKLRKAGFAGCIDTEEAVLTQLALLRDRRIIP